MGKLLRRAQLYQSLTDPFWDFGSLITIGLDNSRSARSAAKDNRDIGSHRSAANNHSM